MSTKCSIVCAGPIHIYECVNTYDDDGLWEICMCPIERSDWKHDSYNDDPVLGRKVLREMYEQLKAYYEREKK